METSDPPAFTPYIDELQNVLTEPRKESVPEFAKRLAAKEQEPWAYVILGSPGSGKSALAVQLMHWFAHQFANGCSDLLPVYVNLTHFGKQFTPDVSGLESLVRVSVAQGCPRYLHVDEECHAAQRNEQNRIIGPDGETDDAIYFFDGMDEMPANGFLKRVAALGRFMDRRRGCLFVVTCRPEDFVKLSDHLNNLRVKRFDLLPWTVDMAGDYLSKNKLTLHDQREILDSLASEGRITSESTFSPLEVALRARIWSTGHSSNQEIFSEYLRGHIQARLQSDVDVDDAIAQLGKLAFSQIWTTPVPSLSTAVRQAAVLSGIVRETPQGLLFEVRPLFHHLASSELVRRIIQGEHLPDDVTLADINHRDVFRAASTIAGSDSRWYEWVMSELARECQMRELGNRLWVGSYALNSLSLCEDGKLRDSFTRVIASLVVEGDDVERDRCVQVLDRHPRLLESDQKTTQAMFTWVLRHGPADAVDWLVQLFVRHPVLRRRHRKLWLVALRRTLDYGNGFSKHLWLDLFQRSKIGRASHALLNIVRVVGLFAGMFAIYYAGAAISTLSMFPIGSLLGSPISLRLSLVDNFVNPDFVTPPVLVTRVILFVTFVAYPRSVLIHRLRDGLGPKSWASRITVLVGIAASGLIVFNLINTVWFALERLGYRLPGVILAIATVAAVLLLAGAVLAAVRRRAEAIFVLPSRRRPRPRPNLPEFETVPDTRTLDAERQRLKRAAVRVIVVFAMGLIALPVFGPGVALAFFGLSVGAVAILLLLVEPHKDAINLGKKIEEQVQNGLRVDLRSTVIFALQKIAKPGVPWIRMAYVQALAKVRFDADLLDILERVYATLPQDEIREKLTKVVSRAYHEVESDEFERRRYHGYNTKN